MLGSIGFAVYRGEVADAGVVDEAARESLGGTVAAAGELPAEAGTALVTVAREAFVHGLHTTAIVGAAVALALAVLAATLLRNVSPGSGEH